MSDATTPAQRWIPADDPQRHLTVARPQEDETLPHVGLVGDTYTILVSGDDTAGQYTLIDMHVPPGGGPPPHRHDFEEMFTVLEGEVELSFRGEHLVARAGETVNVPANAPHGFRNASWRASPAALHVQPTGAGTVFHCRRHARTIADGGTSAPGRRRPGRVRRQSQGACSGISHRVLIAVAAEPLSCSTSDRTARALVAPAVKAQIHQRFLIAQMRNTRCYADELTPSRATNRTERCSTISDLSV